MIRDGPSLSPTFIDAPTRSVSPLPGSPRRAQGKTSRRDRTAKSPPALSRSSTKVYTDIESDMKIKCCFRKANGEPCNQMLLDSESFIRKHVREHSAALPGSISQCPLEVPLTGKSAVPRTNRRAGRSRLLLPGIYTICISILEGWHVQFVTSYFRGPIL